MSRRVRRGSRLRLVIRSPASIYFQKNLNSGKPVHEERPEDARRCEVRVLHEPGRQTVLRLPVARAAARGT
jgi:predicted acyl esterase